MKFLAPILGGVTVIAVLFFHFNYVKGLNNTVKAVSEEMATYRSALEVEQRTALSLRQTVNEWADSQDTLLVRFQALQENDHEATTRIRDLYRLFAETPLGGLPPAVLDSLMDGMWRSLEAATTSGRFDPPRQTFDSSTASP